jgi:hypothetical protein
MVRASQDHLEFERKSSICTARVVLVQSSFPGTCTTVPDGPRGPGPGAGDGPESRPTLVGMTDEQPCTTCGGPLTVAPGVVGWAGGLYFPDGWVRTCGGCESVFGWSPGGSLVALDQVEGPEE